MELQPESRKTISQYEKLLAEIAGHEIDFAVVGGLAVILNGYPRATIDLDILIHDSPDNIGKLLDCLSKWGEGYARELKPEDFLVQEGSIRVVEEFALDIFTRMLGKSLDDFRPRIRHREMAAKRIPFLSPEDLIYLKQNSWREKDKIDTAAMREIIERENKK